MCGDIVEIVHKMLISCDACGQRALKNGWR